MAAVDLLALRKIYGALTAVDGIDLNIAHEELVCLLGPSGCGKTTTLRLLAGFVVPDEGAIVVGGKTISGPGAAVPPERRGMSMIFQSYALWPHMTRRRERRLRAEAAPHRPRGGRAPGRADPAT